MYVFCFLRLIIPFINTSLLFNCSSYLQNMYCFKICRNSYLNVLNHLIILVQDMQFLQVLIENALVVTTVIKHTKTDL